MEHISLFLAKGLWWDFLCLKLWSNGIKSNKSGCFIFMRLFYCYALHHWAVIEKTFLELCQEGRGNNSIKPSCYYWKALQFLVKNVIGTSTTGKSILTSSWCSNWYGRFLVRAKSCSFISLHTSSLNIWKMQWILQHFHELHIPHCGIIFGKLK